jgi:hypothetical protein
VCGAAWFSREELDRLDITEGTLAVIEKGFGRSRKYENQR